MPSETSNTLGATLVDGGTEFALYSSVAERVELCLFDASGRLQRQLDLSRQSDSIWRLFVPDSHEGQRYAYRVHGPADSAESARCNPAKLLIDPYARQLDGEVRWHASLFDSNNWDSANHMPKAIVRSNITCRAPRVAVPWADTLFYELNVRGYTMRHEGVDDVARGKFAGLRNKEVLAYIKSLGISSIELMPVHAFVDEHHLFKQGLRNFWGYNSINFFAPAPRYGGDDPVTEFRDMVDAIHDAGLEVILDVVYNHTAESGTAGPTLSFRGIDERAYYRLTDAGDYINDTGCGNTIDADSPIAQKIILDSLRYWSGTMGVDGFRFDLATILGRHAHGFNREHPLLRQIAEDSQLRQCKLIAEPWDPGPGGYQLGNFAHPWVEWNDKFRDASRAYWRGDSNVGGDFANRLRGSADIFEATGRLPHTSVNKISSHDGFTLADVVAYEHRHNEANGENNRDGHSHNYSCNYGIEGQSDDPAINELRRRHRLNLLASLFLAQGTPLLLAGDEFGNSQNGNNNAYAQDNDIGWLDWQSLQADPAFTDAVRLLISMRKQLRLLKIDLYIHGEHATPDQQLSVEWINPNGSARGSDDWRFGHAFGIVLKGASQEREYRSITILLNAWVDPVEFLLPTSVEEENWELLFANHDDMTDRVPESSMMPGRSIAIFATRRRADDPPPDRH